MTPTPHTTARTETAETVTLPCPFCGSAGKMIHPMGCWVSREVGYGPNGSRITCTNDDCSGLGYPFYGPDQDAEAIAQWNSRAVLSPQHPVGVREAGPVAWRWRYYDGGPERPWYVRQSPVAPEEPSPGNAGVEVQPLYAHPPAQDAPGAEPGMDWELSDETKQHMDAIDRNSREAAARASSFIVGSALDPSPPLPVADEEVVAWMRTEGGKPYACVLFPPFETWETTGEFGVEPLVRQSALVSALRERDEARTLAQTFVTIAHTKEVAAFASEAAREKAEQVAAGLREGLRSAIKQIEALCSPLDVPDEARAALRASTEEGKTATPSVKEEEAQS